MRLLNNKVVYILPFYEEGTDTHLFYNYELIKRVAARKEVDIFVIVEKWSTLNVGQLGAPYYIQKFSFPPLRFLELFLKCFMLHVSGYRNFYVHYSFYGAMTAWLDGGRVFYWNRGMPWLFKRGWFEERIFRFILRHTILVTGPESLAKEYVQRYGVREYRVLSNWVNVARFEPRAQALDKRTILFIHHISKRKGADLVPEIAEGLGDDVLFLMIGKGPEKQSLEIRISDLGFKEKIKLLGHVPNKDIVEYFQGSDIFIMPSREEGSPHVLLEAMASGTPFVASDVGGVRELVPKELEEFLCPPDDVKCFQKKIKTLLSDKMLYNKVREIGFRHAQNFDIARGVKEFIGLFAE